MDSEFKLLVDEYSSVNDDGYIVYKTGHKYILEWILTNLIQALEKEEHRWFDINDHIGRNEEYFNMLCEIHIDNLKFLRDNISNIY